jgi:hypothetical protein
VASVRAEAWAARADVRDARQLDLQAFLEGDALEQLDHDADRFERIGRRLDQPLLAPVAWMPILGRQLDAVRHQIDAAAEGLRTAAEVGDEVRVLYEQGMGAGPGRVETLRAVERAAQRGSEALRQLDLGPNEALIGPLSSSRSEFERAQLDVIETLDRATAVSRGLAEFFRGPSDYLVLPANNAQMQNGQGMFLSAGVLHVEDGQMELGPFEPLGPLPDVVPPVPLEPDLADRWGWLDPNLDLRHLGVSARYPVTGRTAAELWTALGNPAVDGVIGIDPLVLEAMMTVTGPVETPQGTHSAEDVVAFTLHDQYQAYLVDGVDKSFATDERRDELGALAGAVVEAFEQVNRVEAEFIEELAHVAGGRHLLLWSADPAVQDGFEAAGIHGQIGTDSVLLSLVNRSGNKLDWFMRMSADLRIAEGESGLDASIEVSVTNEAKPQAREPSYVLGPYPGSDLERGEYLGLVTLNLPEGATNGRFDGVDPLAVSGPDGPNRTIAAWVRVDPGTTTTLVARFSLPPQMTVLEVEPSARVSPTRWTFGGARWKDDERRLVEL